MSILNIAHRGGAAMRPENTMAAFSHAIALGCDGAEMDVHLSADGVVVVHHDDRLNPDYARDKNGNWLAAPTPLIRELTLAQLQSYDLGHVRPGSDYALRHPAQKPVKHARIPTLAEVAAAARAAKFRLMVELKVFAGAAEDDAVRLADATLDVMKDDLARTIFVGFDWRCLLRIKKNAPDARVWFTTDKLEGDVAPVIAGIAAAGAQGWFPHYADLTPESVAAARALNLQCGGWTVNDAEEMKRIARLKPDAICSDRPKLLKAVLDALT